MVNIKNYPVIFMGDFNSEPNTKRILDLKKQMNECSDFSKEKRFGPSGTFNDFKYHEPVTRMIDYIFISQRKKITVNK